MEAQAKFVGIDVSKARLDVGVWPGAESFSTSNDERGIAQLVERVLRLAPRAVVRKRAAAWNPSPQASCWRRS
jgi:hypothetical protein